jgi:hypothetical protein
MANDKIGKKEAKTPAVQTERQIRAARLPKFTGKSLDTTNEQIENLKDELHTDHDDVLCSTVVTAISGNLEARREKVGKTLNIALQLLTELAPQSALERLLVAQLIACDNAASQCLRIGFHEDNPADTRSKYLGIGLQFQGVLVRQIEALAKLRNGGQQRVTVEHVHVHQGGQAVIGNVQGGGGGGTGGRE